MSDKNEPETETEETAAESTPPATTAGRGVEASDWLGLGDLWGRWPEWISHRWPERLSALESGMRIEEYVEDDTLVIRGEVPGVDPADIDISVEGGRLSIRAEREERTESKDGYRSEFRYGSYARVLNLPEGTQADDISASYDDGILEVRVPISQEAGSSKKISVERGG